VKYNQPYGVSDPNASYVNGNPATGTMGSIPPAEAIEFPQREIANLITGTGVTATNADPNQLAKAIQSGRLYYGLDSGSANHMVCALVPTPPSLRKGMFCFIEVAADNTGASDLTTNGVSAGVTRRDGTPLVLGDLKMGQMCLLCYDGVRWQMVSGGGGGSVINALTQNLDLYVNDAIGNDANDGTANDAAHALKTVQRAVNIAQSYLPSNFGVNIRIANGTYNENVSTTYVSSPAINIIGNVANPDLVIVGLSGACTYPKLGGLIVQGPNVMSVEGVCGRSGTYGLDNPAAFLARAGAVMNIKNTSSLFAQGAVFEAYGGATLNINGNHKFKVNNSPSTGCGFTVYAAGNIYISNSLSIQFNFEAGVVWSQTVGAVDNGVIQIQGHAATWVGATPTGLRYYATLNGIIDTQGGGATYIPGTVAGSTNTGGQYG
jgi:hypothetical protein